MKIFSDLSYSENGRLDLFLPEGEGFATVIWFHGGGMTAGSKADGRALAEDFAAAGYAFASVDYRLYSQGARFPDFLCDAAAAVSFIRRGIASFGGDEERLYVSGASAGGWISLMLCLDGGYLRSAGVDPLSIRGWIIDSAQTTSHFNVQKHEAGEDPRAQRIDRFAPLLYVGEQTAFSKMLLIFYENDMPCRYEQNMLFYKAVLFFHPDADIAFEVLPGGHCSGSSARGADGEFPFVRAALRLLGKDGRP